MRILVVSHYFDPHRGGIEIVAARQAQALAALGHHLTWAATDATSPAASSFDVLALPAWNIVERRLGLPMPLLKPAGVRMLRAAVRSADLVLVHDGLYTTSLAALALARQAGRPTVVVQHIGAIPYRNPVLNAAMRAANGLIVRPALASASQAVFISEAVKAHFAGTRYARAPETIFNGIAPYFSLPTANERADFRAQLGLGHRRTALFVGRFVEKKGLHHIRVAATRQPETLFLLAGWGVIDPRSWGLANVRVIEGLQGAALAALYGAADMLILPSVGEGLPLVIQEALACGLPVICGEEAAGGDPALGSWVSTIPVLSNAAETGLRLADAIDRHPGHDPVAATARARFAHERYSWSDAANRYAALMTALAAPARTIPPRPIEVAA